ncbi:MAG: sulfotransferase [Phycisphaerae bacterium]
MGPLLRLLVRHRFAVAPSRWHVLVGSLVSSAGNSLLGLVQDGAYGRRIARVPIEPDPLFILGHWRCGTTLLHELLALDPRHTAPNTYQCIVPAHFLITQGIARRACGWLLARRRAMDAVAVGLSRPQEDEFALCNMGARSLYERIAFPNFPRGNEIFELDRHSEPDRARWQRTFERFLQSVLLKTPGMLVLKSPLHAFRLPFLLERFKQARFVHIVRNPYDVFPSAMHMWRALYWTQGLQRPTRTDLDRFVLETFERFHEAMDRARPLLRERRFHEMRFEDLCAAPVEQMHQLYDRLELDGFAQVEPAIVRQLPDLAAFRRNRYELAPARRDELTRRWGPIAARHGYPSHA